MKKLSFLLLFVVLFASCDSELISDHEQSAQMTNKALVGPIDRATGLINNEYFGIKKYDTDTPDPNCPDAEKTSIAISNALKWANENGIRKVKLETGTYVIDGKQYYNQEIETYSYTGIKVPSNIDFDLNGSTLLKKTCDYYTYYIIYTENASNVKIHNGTLIGDRTEHEYKNFPARTHEHGFGVVIRGGSNVEIANMDISEMTGDAILVDAFYKLSAQQVALGAVLPKGIKISNSLLHHCRRQGISVVGVDGIEICNNRIYQIGHIRGTSDKYGTAPQSCIDLEVWWECDYPNENVNIHHNYLQSNAGIGCIMYNRIQKIDFDSNTLDGCGVTLSLISPPVNDKGVQCNITNNIISDVEVIDPETKKLRASICVGSNLNKEFKGKINGINISGNKLTNANAIFGSNDYNIKGISFDSNEIRNGHILSKNCIGESILLNKIYNGYIYIIGSEEARLRSNSIENATFKSTGVSGWTHAMAIQSCKNTMAVGNSVKNGHFMIYHPRGVQLTYNNIENADTSVRLSNPIRVQCTSFDLDPSPYDITLNNNTYKGFYGDLLGTYISNGTELIVKK